MTNRSLKGTFGDGTFGMRFSRPGYDVWTEPFGSPKISFDTRLSDIGTVVASGLILCGGGPVLFPTMNYVPIVKIFRWNGSALEDQVYFAAVAHRWLPAVAIVTPSSIEVVAYTIPWVATTNYFNPNGSYYLYYVFASG